MLDDLSFGEALSWLAGEFGRRSGIEVQLRLDAARHVRTDAMSTGLFRIVQESLTNIARHAGATKVRIELLESDGRLRLKVRDNGCGIDPRRIGTGVGLLSMRERATALGASLHIVAAQGGGTEIELDMPLHDTAAEGVPT
jgi:signal transduction histidine kinase